MKFSAFIFNKRNIFSLIVLLLSEVLLWIFMENPFCQDSWISVGNLPIKNIWVISFLLLVIFIALIGSFYFMEKNKQINQQNKQCQDMIAKYDRVIDTYNQAALLDEGNKIFHMALALDTFEFSRIKLLIDAAEKYHHLYAGIMVANLHHSGLFHGDVEIVKKDYEQAYYFYKLVEDYDYIGVVLWRLGWMLENGEAELHLTEMERKKKALEYYEKAKEKGYVKAYNSIGKFYNGGIVVDKNPIEAVYHFREATKRGDIYSPLNEAYIHAQNKDTYDLAIQCFEHAIQQNSALAYLKFGEFLDANADDYNHPQYNLTTAFDLYAKAAKLSNGTIAARAYYKIGQLLLKDISIIGQRNQDVQEMFGNRPKDIIYTAYQKSALLFEKAIRSNMKFSDADQTVYQLVKTEIHLLNNIYWL